MKSTFLNQLKQEDFIAFLNNNPQVLFECWKNGENGCLDKTNTRIFSNGNSVELNTFGKKYNQIFTFNDFGFCEDPIVFYDEIYEVSWIKFMYHKFGEEYKTALAKHVEEEKQAKIDKITKKADNIINMI